MWAKSFFTVGQWTDPNPVGHLLEIIPTSDLSKVKAGELVSFKVLYKGKPLKTYSKEGREKT